jgi:hypothetical protein
MPGGEPILLISTHSNVIINIAAMTEAIRADGYSSISNKEVIIAEPPTITVSASPGNRKFPNGDPSNNSTGGVLKPNMRAIPPINAVIDKNPFRKTRISRHFFGFEIFILFHSQNRIPTLSVRVIGLNRLERYFFSIIEGYCKP